MLPEPESDALAASARLVARIRAELAAAGNWIGFARYMELALYAPGLGYYAGGAAKLGAPGDFATAPEMGTLFARALARQVAELLQPGEAILEFGAGSGALAEALIAELAPERYLILETSAELAARQRARLGSRAQWLERLPERFRGVMLANEVADAMPVHALAWRREGVMERGVSVVDGALAWAERPAQGELREAAARLRHGLQLRPQLRDHVLRAGVALAARLEARGGFDDAFAIESCDRHDEFGVPAGLGGFRRLPVAIHAQADVHVIRQLGDHVFKHGKRRFPSCRVAEFCVH